MPAAASDKFKKISDGSDYPNVARVSSPRSGGGTTLACDDLTGWTTETGVSFVTYQLDTAGTVTGGTLTTWEGVVSGNNITNVSRIKGAADGGNAINDVVQLIPDSNWADDLIAGILVSHDQDGTLKAGAVDTSTVLANEVVTTAKYADASITNAKLATSEGELGGAWQSWTPTLVNLSGGTIVFAKYQKIGKGIFWKFRYTLAGAGVSGAVTITTPTTMSNSYLTSSPIGFGWGGATSGSAFRKLAATVDTATFDRMLLWSESVSGSTITVSALSSTSPATWANTGFIDLEGFYEAP